MNAAEDGARPATVGLALALIEATKTGNRKQVLRLANMFSTRQLTRSVVELSKRMVFKSVAAGDVTTLMELQYIVSTRGRAYSVLGSSLVDRRWRWSRQMNSARTFGDMLFEYYIVCAQNDTSPTDDNLTIRANSSRWARKWAIAIGYYITHLAYELADRDNVDIETRIAGYRAYAAAEAAA